MSVHTFLPRITRFSLPADPSASSVLRRFIRDMSQGTELSADELGELENAAVEAFHSALDKQVCPGEGRIALKIDARPNEITVDVTYRETHFPPAEVFSRS